MKTIPSVAEMQSVSESLRNLGKRVGVVPTMGYLHEGHLSLVRIAKGKADVVVTTIFVNPKQFGPEEDFKQYPRDPARDAMMLQSAGVDYLFLPNEKEMYSDGFVSFVEVEKITGVLEGKFRPTHFRGVATVVAKLFNITKPHCAVFGQKDAQQVAVIRQMVKDLNFDVELIVAPIVREPDGLAMSSRNIYLSADERKQSLVLSESLELAQRLVARGERNPATVIKKMTDLISSKPAARVDYVSIADPSTLQECRVIGNGDVVLVSLAVHFGRTRLIDNKLVTA